MVIRASHWPQLVQCDESRALALRCTLGVAARRLASDRVFCICCVRIVLQSVASCCGKSIYLTMDYDSTGLNGGLPPYNKLRAVRLVQWNKARVRCGRRFYCMHEKAAA